MACWLIEQWIAKGDPRGNNPKRFALAKAIAEGKGVRINGEEVLQHAEATK